MPTALITGMTGQDGSYLAEMLLALGYRVIGAVRRSSLAENLAIESLINKVELVEWDMLDQTGMIDILSRYMPDEMYNYAAYSSGIGMFDDPIGIGEVNGLAVTRILEAIRQVNPAIRFCQASSSEMFGHTRESPQSEQTVFHPRTPYGSAKLYAHCMIDIYRKHYGVFACSAILYNHESPRRGKRFVTRKVAHAAAAIKLGLTDRLILGTLEARRDWGYAKDYVNAMHLMLQHDLPDDYVVATGITHSIADLCECAFGYLGLDYREFVSVEGEQGRASEAAELAGDASKIKKELGWKAKFSFQELIQIMVDHELEQLKS